MLAGIWLRYDAIDPHSIRAVPTLCLSAVEEVSDEDIVTIDAPGAGHGGHE